MRRFIIFIAMAICLSSLGFSQDRTELLQKITPSLAIVKSDVVMGYGFFVGNNTLISTISTIGKHQKGTVLFANGKVANLIGFVATDDENDLVLLKIDNDSAEPATIASYMPMPNQSVFLLTRNGEEKPELIAAKLNAFKDLGNIKLITVKANAPLKTAGFPVLDSVGNVLGMTVSSPIEGSAMTFATPAEKILHLIKNSGELKGLESLTSIFDLISKQAAANEEKARASKEFREQGFLRLSNKEYSAAIEKFSMVIRINPSDADAYAFRGQAKCLQLRFKEALEDFNKALELQPEFAEVYDMRGVCKAELGDKVGACEDWTLSYEKGYDPAFKLIEKFCPLEY